MKSRRLGSKSLHLGLGLLLSVPEPPSGRPLIYTGDARRFIESQPPVYTRTRVGLFLIPNLQYKLYTGRFTAAGIKPTTASGLYNGFLGFNILELLLKLARPRSA